VLTLHHAHRLHAEQLAVGGSAGVRIEADADPVVDGPELAGFEQIVSGGRFALEVLFPSCLRQPVAARRFAACSSASTGSRGRLLDACKPLASTVGCRLRTLLTLPSLSLMTRSAGGAMSSSTLPSESAEPDGRQ
jgi:hypothetical protein